MESFLEQRRRASCDNLSNILRQQQTTGLFCVTRLWRQGRDGRPAGGAAAGGAAGAGLPAGRAAVSPEPGGGPGGGAAAASPRPRPCYNRSAGVGGGRGGAGGGQGRPGGGKEVGSLPGPSGRWQ